MSTRHGRRGPPSRFAAKMNPAFAAAHGIQETKGSTSGGGFRDTAITSDQARDDTRRDRSTAGLFSVDGDGGERRPGSKGRLQHALKAARSTGRLNLSDCGLTAPLPDSAFDLRSGVTIDLSMDSDDVNPWEVRGEETLTLVDFSDNDLSSSSGQSGEIDGNLDERVEKFEAVRNLRARRCRIRNIPWQKLGRLDNLTLLDLSGNGIRHAPLQSLPMALKELDISSNRISSLSHDGESGAGDAGVEVVLPGLIRLDVTDNQLTAFPPLLRLPILQTLQFSKNQISEPMDCLIRSCCRTLSTLEGPKNLLSSPLDLMGCTALRVVDLSDNRLNTPPTVHRSLVRLGLSNNAIGSIGGMFGDTVNPETFRSELQELRLRRNVLAGLEDSVLCCLTNITLLDVGENDLRNLPGILGYLPKLRRLPVDRNPLRAIRLSLAEDTDALKRSLRKRGAPPSGPGYLGGDDGRTGDRNQQEAMAKAEAKGAVNESMVGTHTLDLSNREYSALPDTIIAELRAKIASVRDEETTIGSSVKTLKLSHNGLQSISEHWINALPNLTRLDAGFNKLEGLPTNLGMLPLTVIELNRNWLVSESIADSALCRLGQQTTPSYLAEKLVHLNLSSNGLQWIPSGMMNLAALSTLILSHNRIKTIAAGEDNEGRATGWRPGLPYLEVLDLSDNHIANLGEAPLSLGGCCPRLLTLVLRNNDLRSFPPELGMLQTLNTIDLRGNPQKAIRPAVLDRSCGAILSFLRSRMDETKEQAAQQRIQELSSCFISVPSGELEGGTKIDDGIAWRDITNKIKDAGLSSSAGAAVISPVPLTSSLADELKKQIDDLTMQLNNVYLSEAKKYATKKTLAMQKAKLIREERRLKSASSQCAP